MTECPTCGKDYRSVGTHWRRSASCGPNDIGSREEDIIVGWLLGDGSLVNRDDDWPMLSIANTNRDFIKWSVDEISIMKDWVGSVGTTDCIEKRSISHPFMSKFSNWYDSGVKKIPYGYDISILSAKVWYCCDGFKSVNRGVLRVGFSIGEIEDRVDRMKSSLETALPEPKVTTRTLYYDGDEAKDVLDIMGDPLPGMEYKWESGNSGGEEICH